MEFPCRTCLFKVEKDGSTNIFCSYLQNMLISEILIKIASVDISEGDNLPEVVCNNCLEKLKNTLAFCEQIVDSDFQLRNHLDDNSVDSKEVDGRKEVLLDSEEKLDKDTLELPEIIIKEELVDDNVVIKAEVQNDEEFNTNKEKKKSVFKCKECNEIFKSCYSLKSHMIEHTGIVPFHCDICKKGFPMKSQMNVHRQVHLEDRPFKCPNCPNTFRFHSSVIAHNKRIHLGINKPFKCDVCNKTFSRTTELEVHLRKHTGERPYVCEICSKSFKASFHLSGHLKTHKKVDPKVKCPVCGKMFVENRNLKKHLKSHSAERPFKCEVCSKGFKEKWHLNTHMSIHEGL